MLTGRERGSTLALMPAAVLVFVVLGALCVDMAAVHQGQRALVVAAQGAAGDAAAVAFDEEGFYASGAVRLDLAAARRAARASLAASAPEATLASLVVDPDRATVEVRVTSSARTVFARALPGGPRTVALSARARADLVG